MDIGLLGPLTVDGAGVDFPRRDRVVLAALALKVGEDLTAERLADALWRDELPASWVKVLQGCVVRLRKALGSATIRTVPQGYRLEVPADQVDAVRFERLLLRGRELLTLAEPDRAAYVLGEALTLWRGPALTELEAWEPGRLEAGRLEELRLDAEELRLEAAIRTGRHRETLGAARASVEDAPLRERRWALLALAQYQSGRQAEALRTLREARTMLATELGLDPGPDLVALEAAIRGRIRLWLRQRQRPRSSGLSLPRSRAVRRGRRRRTSSAAIETSWPAGNGWVRRGAGRGRSVGKRQVIAGAGRRGRGARPRRPQGRRHHARAASDDALTAVPSTGPRRARRRPVRGSRLAVRRPGRAGPFFAALSEWADRAHWSWPCGPTGSATSRPPRLRPTGRARAVPPGPMAGDDLGRRSKGRPPAAGLLLEPGLVDLLVREVEGEPGALPLLSHALRQTWELREGHVDGGRLPGPRWIRGAVAQSAEEVYEGVPPDRRAALRDLLLRLVAPSPEGERSSRVPRRLVTGPAITRP